MSWTARSFFDESVKSLLLLFFFSIKLLQQRAGSDNSEKAQMEAALAEVKVNLSNARMINSSTETGKVCQVVDNN